MPPSGFSDYQKFAAIPTLAKVKSTNRSIWIPISRFQRESPLNAEPFPRNPSSSFRRRGQISVTVPIEGTLLAQIETLKPYGKWVYIYIVLPVT